LSQLGYKLVLVSPGMSGYQFVDEWTHRQGEAGEEAFAKGDVARAVEHFLIMWTDGPYRSPEQVNSSVRERNRKMATQAISQGIPTLERHELERIFVEGDEAFVTYRCVAKGGKTFRNTEFFVFEGDKVKRIHVYFGATYDNGAFVRQPR